MFAPHYHLKVGEPKESRCWLRSHFPSVCDQLASYPGRLTAAVAFFLSAVSLTRSGEAFNHTDFLSWFYTPAIPRYYLFCFCCRYQKDIYNPTTVLQFVTKQQDIPIFTNEFKVSDILVGTF